MCFPQEIVYVAGAAVTTPGIGLGVRAVVRRHRVRSRRGPAPPALSEPEDVLAVGYAPSSVRAKAWSIIDARLERQAQSEKTRLQMGAFRSAWTAALSVRFGPGWKGKGAAVGAIGDGFRRDVLRARGLEAAGDPTVDTPKDRAETPVSVL